MPVDVFTDDEVLSLAGYQESRAFHPYTCARCGATLVPTHQGWQCPSRCGYIQLWAYDYSKDWSWQKGEAAIRAVFQRSEEVKDG